MASNCATNIQNFWTPLQNRLKLAGLRLGLKLGLEPKREWGVQIFCDLAPIFFQTKEAFMAQYVSQEHSECASTLCRILIMYN